MKSCLFSCIWLQNDERSFRNKHLVSKNGQECHVKLWRERIDETEKATFQTSVFRKEVKFVFPQKDEHLFEHGKAGPSVTSKLKLSYCRAVIGLDSSASRQKHIFFFCLSEFHVSKIGSRI